MSPDTPTPTLAQGAVAVPAPRAVVPDAYFVMAIESSAQANTWYRIRRRRDGAASDNALLCDCPAWVFARRRDRPAARPLAANGPDEPRACKHTRVAQALLSIQRPQSGATTPHAGRSTQAAHTAAPMTLAWAPTPTPGARAIRPTGAPPITPTRPNTLADAERTAAVRDAICARWPALGELHGEWEVEERDGMINGAPYSFVVVRLTTGGGLLATGALAQARRHHPTAADLLPGAAQWVGYALAVGVALAARLPATQAEEPEHFRVGWRPRANRPHTPYTPTPQPDTHGDDGLRAGDVIDLGDGLAPAERAENTLRLVIGDDLYQQLETQHYLDVASVAFARQERVYRVRRDPAKQRDRRVRIFEHGQYVRDFCIVRAQSCPEADQWLTVFLRLLADEQGALSVVQRGNIFPPNSDDPERETASAVWRYR